MAKRTGVCPGCREGRSVTGDGTMRKHPKGAPVPCSGTGKRPVPTAEQRAEGERLLAAGIEGAYNAGKAMMAQARANAALSDVQPVPGVYRSPEPMLDPAAPVPPGYAVLSIVAYFPYDASVRSPEDEAHVLFADPNYLEQVLARVPNSLVRIQMKVPG